MDLYIYGADDSHHVEMVVGNSANVYATVIPYDAGSALIGSSDNSIVSYNGEENVVYAHRAGTATVTAYAGGKSSSVEITVLETVRSMEINADAYSDGDGFKVNPDSEVHIGLYTEPWCDTEGRVSWSSSDPSIATAEDG